WLVRLLPELASGSIEPLPTWTLTVEHERRLMMEATGRFLTNIAGPMGALLVLDDLQWAGQDALDLLGALVRVAEEIPLRVIGAYRDTELHPEHPLSALIIDLSIAGMAAELPLGPLAFEDVTCLLDDLLGSYAEAAVTRNHLLERSGGVPFFVISYARSVQAGILAEGSVLRAPRNLAQSVRQRVAALPEPARELLGVAAVAGRTVPRAVLLAAMEAQAGLAILQALDAACQARLLEEIDATTYRFTHDVIREVVEEDLGAARRASLHGKVAEAIEREAGDHDLEALAFHYDRSDLWKSAVQYLERAGDHAAAQYANATAEQLYQTTLERLDQHGRDLDGARVREKLASILMIGARYDVALTMLTKAADALRHVVDREGVARITARIGLLHAEKGTPGLGVAWVRPLLDQPGMALARGTQSALHLAMARLSYYLGRYEEQLAAATRASELARIAGDSRTLATALADRGLALYSLDRNNDALQALAEAIRLAEAGGYPNELCIALDLASCIFEDTGEFAVSRHYIERAMRAAEQCGNAAEIAVLPTRRGMSAFYLGDWRQARQDYEQAVALSRQLEPSWRSPWPLVDLGRLCLHEGKWEEAFRYLRESLGMAGAATDLNLIREAHCLLAEYEVLTGHAEAAKACLIPLLDRPGMTERQTTRLLPLLALAQLELGALEDAAATVTRAINRARDQGARMLLVDALRIQVVISIRGECWDVTESALQEGLALARSISYRYAEARLLYLQGTLWARQGELDLSRERLHAAWDIFQHLGAHKDIEQVERDLTGIPPGK
ncbi:MAG TPA: tetratricopeptide repeat protein, partial [Chloroflexota bacterium]|nr:tetratricopeptide repeat protein [Chloroflexota bacterium]